MTSVTRSLRFRARTIAVAAVLVALLATALAPAPAAEAAVRPTVSSISPATGSISGDTVVRVKGKGFTKKTKFYFGSARAEVTSVTATRAVLVSPVLPKAGSYKVTAKTGTLKSTPKAKATFRATLPRGASGVITAKQYLRSDFYWGGNWANTACSEAVAEGSSKIRITTTCIDDGGKSTVNTFVHNTTNGKRLSRTVRTLPTGWSPLGVSHLSGSIYVLLARGNYGESTSRQVYTVIKYTTKLKEVSRVSIKAGSISYGVVDPFAATSPSFAIAGETAYIYLGRTLFRADDGWNHQKNLLLTFNARTMASLKEATRYPWASHSFNQLIHTADDRLVLADHGDAYPRALQVAVEPATDASSAESATFNALKISGRTGDNYTGTTMNGMAVADSRVLLTGTSVPHKYAISGVTGSKWTLTRNVFLTSTNTDTGKSTLTWITKYHPEKSKEVVSEPAIVKVSSDRVVVLYQSTTAKGATRLVYVVADTTGKVRFRKSFSGVEFAPISAPVLEGKRILWVGRDGNGGSYLYRLDVSSRTKPVLGTLR